MSQLIIRKFIAAWGDELAGFSIIAGAFIFVPAIMLTFSMRPFWYTLIVLLVYLFGAGIIRILSAYAWSESPETWDSWIRYRDHNSGPMSSTKIVAFSWPGILVILPIYLVFKGVISCIEYVDSKFEEQIIPSVPSLDDTERRAHQQLAAIDPEFVKTLEKVS